MDKFLHSVIRWSFYSLFFLVPLVFYSKSFELFEYSKMMLTYGITVIILAAWLGRMVVEQKIIFKRTFLDWAIIFYVCSHLASTIFSIDMHTSIWGYYSRFHEGLLATLSYVVLYYALVSNLTKKDVIRSLLFSFASGVIVSVWGTLEHFGASLSCVLITGQANDDCWIQDVKNRVFATLGQPNWMAAYLDVLILATLGFIFRITGNVSPADVDEERKLRLSRITADENSSSVIRNTLYVILAGLFFAALLFTKSRSGLLGLFAGGGIFGAGLILSLRAQAKQSVVDLFKNKTLLLLLSLLLLLVSLFGLPFDKIDQLTIPNLLGNKAQAPAASNKPPATSGYIDIGISESGDIRKIVWKGAIKVWQRYPIFGSGVETFAYAYYKDRPTEHNYVSEWDFLYNKAHNEFLNVLATTGTVGMLAYLSMVGAFSWWVFKRVVIASPDLIRGNQSVDSKNPQNDILVLALFAAYVSILVTNFFGFSVVIIGIYFFLIPGFCILLLTPVISESVPLVSVKSAKNLVKSETISGGQWLGVGIVALVALFMEWNLVTMFQADEAFAYGKNLDGIQSFSTATPYLLKAVEMNGDEATFKDELSFNEATLTTQLFNQASGSAAEKAAMIKPYLEMSIKSSDEAVSAAPNNLSFWKTRTKVFYQLTQIDPQYISQALSAIAKAVDLAPTDPKVRYNYGLILGRVGQTKEAIKAFEDTVALKADYADAHYALGLYYAQDNQKEKAKEQMEFMLKRIGPDERAQKWLEENP